MPWRGNHAAWSEDDELEVKQSLHQKEAITAQMIGIISSRLNSLQTTGASSGGGQWNCQPITSCLRFSCCAANNRKHGLECDLRVNSDYCSKLVPALQDSLESRGGSSAKARAVSSSTLASNQAMLERLFGPDEKTRAHAVRWALPILLPLQSSVYRLSVFRVCKQQVLKKKKMELHKGENRRNARGQIEKQLQASIEGHITRTVESFVYGASDSEASGASGAPNARGSVYMNTNLLLQHTLERMHISHGRPNFKRFLLSELSGALFEEVFWLGFCHFYQKDSMTQQRVLVDELSAKYVKMVAMLHGSMDYLFRIYPYAVASGVCWGFHYLFPGSRHLYTPDFKNEVYLFVCQLLLGLKMTPTSVQAMRRQYFPEEAAEDLGAKGKPTGKLAASASASAGIDTGLTVSCSLQSSSSRDLLHLPRLPSPQTLQANGGLARSASEASYLGKQALSDNSIAKILELRVRSTDDDEEDNDGLGTARRFRRHQQRSLFNAAQLSPLMKEYFRSPTKNAKKACFVLRTTPAADCAVGGEETYRKAYRRKTHKGYAAEAQREQDKCLREIQQVQRDTKREINALHETRDLVLSSGKKALQAYCTVLMSRRSAAEEEDASSAPSCTFQIAKQTHSNEEKLEKNRSSKEHGGGSGDDGGGAAATGPPAAGLRAGGRDAEKKALEARDRVETLLRSAEGVAQLRGSGALQDMKRLVPDVSGAPCDGEAVDEQSDHDDGFCVSDFVLGMIFEQPFAAFERAFRGFGTEVGPTPLVNCAEKRKAALEKQKSPLLRTDIDFITGSLLTTKWEDGDVVFCHGTCFNDKEWKDISLAAEKLKQGAFFLSTSHVLRTGLFEVVKSLNFAMSWGTATLYIHVRSSRREKGERPTSRLAASGHSALTAVCVQRRRKIGRWAAQMLRGGHSTRTDLLQQQAQEQPKEEGQASAAADDLAASEKAE
ncbi:hypothetical protein BBJ28_00022435 [Nothophytophthora sp. Chile5]|nr:hypothetical protein BBJ28_00022435 [Nothophytophthora sp. Chile5]